MVNLSDGGFLLGGTSSSPISGNKLSADFGNNDYWVVKITTNGDKVWDKGFGGNESEDLKSIIVTSDAGILLGGTSASPISGSKMAINYGIYDYWVVRINANGDKIWDKSFGGSGGDVMYSMVATSDGGFLLGGSSDSPTNNNKTATNYGKSDYWIVKVNTDGDKIWDKSFGGSSDDTRNSIVAASDGGFILGGSSSSPVSGNKSVANYGPTNYWVVKTNTNGDKIWDNTFGGNFYDEMACAINTSDGGFLLGGYSVSPISGTRTAPRYGATDFWVVKIK